ncbi:hypothetical protein [Roseibium sp. RKSG952]|uniref:hypothetical protein n=1 Tax=Roseibium sp. RKSG952 TaxID=2529384 RepID=UPI0012BD1495|nr:hypothetical protein [Roseibium sp. RKSG952]MTH94863.1 hypothetical protein [Roseibium sp. RKSG952]
MHTGIHKRVGYWKRIENIALWCIIALSPVLFLSQNFRSFVSGVFSDVNGIHEALGFGNIVLILFSSQPLAILSEFNKESSLLEALESLQSTYVAAYFVISAISIVILIIHSLIKGKFHGKVKEIKQYFEIMLFVSFVVMLTYFITSAIRTQGFLESNLHRFI